MAYKFQFGPSVMSGALEQEGSVTISDSGVLKMGADTVIDASRNITAVSFSGSNSLDVVGQARLKDILNVSGAILAGGGLTSTAGSRLFGATSFNEANITNVGDIALDSISADGASFSFGSNWTAAGRTCADLGTVTTADINGGSIDGTAIGAAAQSSVKATSLSASGDLNIADNATVNGTSTLHGLVTANAGVKSTYFSGSGGVSYFYASQFKGTMNVTGAATFGSSLSSSATLDLVGAARLKSSLEVSGAATLAGTITPSGAPDTAIAVSADSLYFRDADGAMKRDTVADIMSAVAGDGLAASAGVLNVDFNELTEAAVNVAADYVIFIDSDGNVTRKDTFADYAAAAAGNGLGAASGQLSLDLNELSAGAIASGDTIAFVDADDANTSKKETVDDLATLFAGTGLAAASAVLSLDLNELSAAAVNVAADSIAIIDADDSNNSKKESIADLVSAMAGGGLTATNGVLSTQAGSVAVVGDANATLAEGMNAGSTTFSADRTWTLPAAPSDGDVVYVKAPGSLGGNELIILKGSAAHRIDGAEQVEIESNGGAVSLMYIGSNNWVIF